MGRVRATVWSLGRQPLRQSAKRRAVGKCDFPSRKIPTEGVC